MTTAKGHTKRSWALTDAETTQANRSEWTATSMKWKGRRLGFGETVGVKCDRKTSRKVTRITSGMMTKKKIHENESLIKDYL